MPLRRRCAVGRSLCNPSLLVSWSSFWLFPKVVEEVGLLVVEAQGLLLVLVVVVVSVLLLWFALVLEQRSALARRVVFVRGGAVCFYLFFVGVQE